MASEPRRLRPARVPAHDLAAEESVLGSAMLSVSALDDVVPVLDPEDFYRSAHGTIFGVIRAMHSKGEAIDVVTVRDELKARGQLEEVGGPLVLHELVEGVPSPAAAAHYARIVADAALYRRIGGVCSEALERSFTTIEEGPRALLAEAEGKLLALTRGKGEHEAVGTAELVDAAMAALESRGLADGVPTGLRDLDALLAGMHEGNLVVIGARPGAGKSSLALTIARNVAVTSGRAALFLSLEMSRFEVGMRLLCSEAAVPWDLVRQDRVDALGWGRFVEAAEVLTPAPLAIIDSPSAGVAELRSAARRTPKLGLVVVDYLQLMLNKGGRRHDSREQEVAEISRGLKLLAKELHVPVIAVSQLNRDPERRQDKRPTLADLRNSGAIEQDADVVILLHRDDASKEREGVAEAIVAKHRNGPTATVRLAFRGPLMTFANLAAQR